MLQQEQRVLQFLIKLNDNFSVVRGNILMMTPMLNVTQAYKLVVQEQSHKEISQHVNQNDALAFVADRKRFNTQYSTTKYQQNSSQQNFSNFQQPQTQSNTIRKL